MLKTYNMVPTHFSELKQFCFLDFVCYNYFQL